MDKEKVDSAIKDLCIYFDEVGLTLGERWYVCMCIERTAEQIMASSFDDIADKLQGIRQGRPGD